MKILHNQEMHGAQNRKKGDRTTKITKELASGMIEPPEDFADMLRKKGDLHEQLCLKDYQAKYPGSVFEVPERNEAEYESFSLWIDRIGNPMEGSYSVIFGHGTIVWKIDYWISIGRGWQADPLWCEPGHRRVFGTGLCSRFGGRAQSRR